MASAETQTDVELDGLLNRLVSLADEAGSATRAKGSPEPPADLQQIRSLLRDEELITSANSGPAELEPRFKADGGFFPVAPRTFAEAHVSESHVETIILRLLSLRGALKGVEIAQQIFFPFSLAEKVLQALKTQRLVAHKNAGTLSDFIYELTEAGANKIRQNNAQSTYCGSVPVSLKDYSASVAAQSLSKLEPQLDDLRRAFADMTLSEEMFRRLGLAIAAGKGLFLYGRPGNGKTSVAERITAVYGTSIWIPRAIDVWGEIVRVYDPSCHEQLPLARGERIIDEEKVDHRWVRIRRPTIVVGGELTMQSLDVTINMTTGVSEAPIQMKSNCGTLVIDDFGRQRIAPAELLNRWIVPLEKRIDYLGLASGRKFSVPFDQFVVFSTNLEPSDLVDEAFLRRIPYKIEVENPSKAQFCSLFQKACKKMGLELDDANLEHLLARHYTDEGREMRFCHPRDLLNQVAIYCRFFGLPPTVTIEALDVAAVNYFSATGR